MNYYDILFAKKMGGGEAPPHSYQLKTITTPTSLATFNASAMPMPKLKVSVEAKQDLHGYDKPWVGGAGKNKFNKNGSLETGKFIQADGTVVSSTNWNITDYQQITPNTYTMSGATAGEGGYYGICWYDSEKTYISGFQKFTTSPQTVTIPSNAQYVRYCVNNSALDSFMLEEGSTATSYAPYSNECPISGWSEVNISDVGKNLVSSIEQGGINWETGEDEQSSYAKRTNLFNVDPNTQYTASEFLVDISTIGVVYFQADNTFIRSDILRPSSGIVRFTTPSNAKHAKIGGGMAVMPTELQVEKGSTATSYESYINQTTTISLPQTVYGAEVDVVNGILTITDEYIASYNGETLPSTWISSMDEYAEGTSPTTGAEVCYELAEPIIINLTPTLIKSLNGQNNLSVDSGDVIEGEYFIAL